MATEKVMTVMTRKPDGTWRYDREIPAIDISSGAGKLRHLNVNYQAPKSAELHRKSSTYAADLTNNRYEKATVKKADAITIRRREIPAIALSPTAPIMLHLHVNYQAPSSAELQNKGALYSAALGQTRYEKAKINTPQSKQEPACEGVLSAEKLAWLAAYPRQLAGPKPHQLGAFEWFESQGWKSKWPLHYAALTGDASTIRQLCQGLSGETARNADELMADWRDTTPLSWASSFGQLEATIALIAFGAEPFPEGAETPLDRANQEGHPNIGKFLRAYSAAFGQKIIPSSSHAAVPASKGKLAESPKAPYGGYESLQEDPAAHECKIDCTIA